MQTFALLFSAANNPHKSLPFAYRAPDAQLQQSYSAGLEWEKASKQASDSTVELKTICFSWFITEEPRETRAELAMQIQAKDQLKYKGKDMLCDGNNKFDSGSVPLGNYGHLCSSINDIHRMTFFKQFQQ